MIREALETQVLEHEPVAAAQVIETGVRDLGPEVIASALLDAAAVALRRMVAETDAALDRAELMARLALDGAVPEEHIELLGDLLTIAASTAGGIRPPIEPFLTTIGPQQLLFGAWLATLTAVKVVAMSLERTEADVVEEILLAVESF